MSVTITISYPMPDTTGGTAGDVAGDALTLTVANVCHQRNPFDIPATLSPRDLPGKSVVLCLGAVCPPVYLSRYTIRLIPVSSISIFSAATRD